MRLSPLLQETFKRAQRGLFAGETIRFGDQVSEMGNRSRRTWKPNVQRVNLWSETLQEQVFCRVTTTALGLIDKAGGLDNYILGQRHPESRFALQLKTRILLRRLEAERREDSPGGGGVELERNTVALDSICRAG